MSIMTSNALEEQIPCIVRSWDTHLGYQCFIKRTFLVGVSILVGETKQECCPILCFFSSVILNFFKEEEVYPF